MISYDGITNLVADIPCDAINWRNCKEIFKTCRQTTLISEMDQSKWLQSLADNKNIKMFGIEARDPDGKYPTIYRPIGVAGLTNINWISRNAEFSLYIAPEYQGRGFAKSALKNLLRHGFEDFGMHKIWGEVFETNPAAIKLFTEHFKMKIHPGHTDHYFKGGKFISTFIVEMFEKDFLK